MKSDLEKCCLYNLLKENGAQGAVGRVRSINLYKEIGEMELVGFIPYTHNYLRQFDYGLNVNLNGSLYLAPNLVQFSKDTPVYPFFKRISSAEERRYKVDEHILIYPIIDEHPNQVSSKKNSNRKYKKPFFGDILLDVVELKKNSPLLPNSEDGRYYYLGKEGEFELSCGIENMIAISDDFLCLCAYMNKVTGTISYVVFHSKEVVRVFSESDNER